MIFVSSDILRPRVPRFCLDVSGTFHIILASIILSFITQIYNMYLYTRLCFGEVESSLVCLALNDHLDVALPV